MTILNGRIVGVDDSEFELRTGGDEEPAGGKIRTASPEAVARFKAFLAAQPAKPAPKAVAKRPGMDPEIARRANEMAVAARAKRAAEMNKQTAPAVEPKEPKEQEKMAMRSAMSDEEIIAAHRRYVLENIAIGKLVADMPIEELALHKNFTRLGLPIRGRNRRWGAASDVDRICKVHGLKIRDIWVDTMPIAESVAKPKAKAEAKPVKAVVKETAVEPVVEPEPEPVAETAVKPGTYAETAVEPVKETAVAPANGAMLTETEIEDQLRAIQQLMSMIGKVENVRISGTMRIDLHAEVVF